MKRFEIRRAFRGGGKHVAFTLAEVLITLGIIGVVAAITLPTLIQNYQKQVWVNQLKKEVSVLQNAVRTIIATEGVENLFDTSFVKSKPYGGDTCFQYSPDKLNLKITGKRRHGYDYAYTGGGTLRYLADGSAFDVAFADNGWICGRGNVTFFVDVNGDKGPNKSNRDQFTFMLDEYGRIVPSGDLDIDIDDEGFAELVEGCKEDPDFCQAIFGTTNITKDHINKMLLDDISSQCSDASRAKFVCTDLIIHDGWKMNY